MQNESYDWSREDRFLGPIPEQKAIALHLYGLVADLPLVCPHGHVDARMFATADYSFGTPTELLLIPDHYVFRMLHSQGISMESLGIPRIDGGAVEQDHRRIWQTFAESFYLFRGTPTGMWLTEELQGVLGVSKKLNADNAQDIYDEIAEKLTSPEFGPRRLYQRFNIEVLCTTDSAADDLRQHQTIRASGWEGRVLPTFRPDAVVNILADDWLEQLDRLAEAADIETGTFPAFVRALESRRAHFRALGAIATDHAVLEPYTAELTPLESEAIFRRALHRQSSPEDARAFTGHMLMEFARMSVEDGLVMQIHAGAYRNHNALVCERFGPDKGADIPVACEFTRNLQPLLNKYGNDTRLGLILFTLDEGTYSRELAPLAGHYPAIKLGPPWWFHDSLNGMRRYFDAVMETAGLHNTAGFNDDTRAFLSIPARHALWRRASADWVAGLVVRGIVDPDEAQDMVREMAYGLAKRAYRLTSSEGDRP